MTNLPMKLTAPAKGIVQRALHGSWFTTAVYACYVAAVFCYCITYPHYFAVHTLIFGKKIFSSNESLNHVLIDPVIKTNL